MLFSKTRLKLLGPQLTDTSGIGVVIAKIHGLVSERFRPENKSKTWNDTVVGNLNYLDLSILDTYRST